MNRWSKVEALLDKELKRQVQLILGNVKKAMALGHKGGNGNGTVTAKPKRKVKIVNIGKKDINRARQLHGAYLGLTRRLTDQQKRDVKDIRARKGVRSAIAAAKKYRASA